jgi:hypothetical protein
MNTDEKKNGKNTKNDSIDNGAKKYMIIVNDTNIFVYDYDNSKQKKVYEIKNYNKIFIGKNTKKYRINNKLYTGSSILV